MKGEAGSAEAVRCGYAHWRCGWVCEGKPVGQGLFSDRRVNTSAWGGNEAVVVEADFGGSGTEGNYFASGSFSYRRCDQGIAWGN